jgi:hypothetical protein
MQAGVAPVLLSDKYDLPKGPDWDSFLLRIPESRLKEIPQILDAHVAESSELGYRARAAWEQWFAPDKVFNNIISVCVRLGGERKVAERRMQILWPWLVNYHWLRSMVRKRVRAGVISALRVIGKVPYALNEHDPL